MIVTLTGTNSFTLQRRLKELVGEFIAKHDELALERIDAAETEPTAIKEAVSSLPFLATRKMIVIRDLSSNKAAAEQIEQIIDSVFDSTDLILCEPSPDKRTVYFKVLKTKTKLEEFNELDNRSLANWMVEEAKNQAGELSYMDANYLVERLGTNQQILASELAKLLTYEPKISRAAIDLLTEPTPQSKIFDLLDAAFSGNKKRAMQLYEEQRAQKIEPQQIVAMITWQLQTLATIKSAGNRSVEDIAREAAINPFVVRKSANLANKMSSAKLKKLVDEVFNLDWRSKTSGLDLDEGLKHYLIVI